MTTVIPLNDQQLQNVQPTSFRQNIDDSNDQQNQSISPQYQQDKSDNDVILPKRSFQMKKQQTLGSIVEDEYFGEDTELKKQKRKALINPQTFKQIRDYDVRFSYSTFLEVLFIHIMFYLVTGPLSLLLFYHRPGIILMRNMGFIGFQFLTFMQYLLYFMNSINILIYFLTDNGNIYLAEIIYLIIIMFLRAFIIACKYASIHQDKYQLYKKHLLGKELTTSDFYLTLWVKQDEFIIYKETYNSLQRGEFDPQMFYIKFFVEPAMEKINAINLNNKALSEHHHYSSEQFQPPCCFKPASWTAEDGQFYFGYGILAQMIKQFSKNNGLGQGLALSLMLALTRSFLTLLYRFVTNNNLSFNSIEYIQIIGLIFNTFLGYASLVAFLVFFTRDMKLKWFLQYQCSCLLSPKKVFGKEDKIFPTIDITNPFALKSWSILRKVALDYGKQYYLRMEAFLTINVLILLISLAIFFSWFFNLYEFDMIYIVISCYEIVVVFTLVSYLLVRGAQVNEQFDSFINILGTIRVQILNLMQFRKIYFEQNQPPQNLLMKKIVQKIKQKLSQLQQTPDQPYNEETVMGVLNEILQSVDDREKEVEQDQRIQPFTFFSFAITISNLQNIGIIILTFIFGCIQYKIFNIDNLTQ